jgi:predicted transcriptional regulator
MAGTITGTLTFSQDVSRDYPATVSVVVTAYGRTSATITCPVTAKSRIHGARILQNWVKQPVGKLSVQTFAVMRLGEVCASAKTNVEGMQKWWDYQVKEGIVRDRKAALDALVAAKAALQATKDKRAACKAQFDAATAELAAAKAQNYQAQLDNAAAAKAAEQARLAAANQAVTTAQNGVAAVQAEFDGQQLVITQILAGGAGAVVARTKTADVHGRTFPVTYRTNSGETAAQMDAKLDALVAKIQQDVLVNRIDYADGYVEQYAWYANAATKNYPVLVWGKWSRGGRTFGTGNVYRCSNETEKERVKAAIAAEAAAVQTTEDAPNWKEIDGGLFVRHYRKYGADGLAECWTLVNAGTGREASNTVVVGRTGRLDARGVHDAEAAAEAAALGWGRTPVSYNGGTYRLFDLPDGRHFAKYQVAAGGRWWTTPTTWSAATAIESECRAIIDRYVANLASAQAQQAATISVEMRATIEDQSTLGRGMVIVSQQDLQARFNALRTAYAQYQKSDPNAPDTGPGSTAPMPVAVVAPVTQIDWAMPVADAPVPDDLSQGWAAHFRDLFEAGWADLRSECPELGIAEGVKDAVENKVQEYMVLLNMDYAGAYAAVKGGIREIYGLATDSAKREQFKNDIVADLEGLADTTPLILAAFTNIGDEAQRFWSVTPQADRYRLASGFIAGIALEFYDPAKKLTFVKYLDRVAPMAARSPATMRSALSKGRLLASCPIAYRVVKSALCIRKFISAGRSMNVRTVAEAYRSIDRAEARALEAIDDLRSIGLSKKGAKHLKAIMDSGFKDAGEFGKLRETDTILIEKLCAKDAKLGVVNPKKIQEHHFLSDKHGVFEEKFLKITSKYGIDDLDDWPLNKAFVTDHVGNHSRNDDSYHRWMMEALDEIHSRAAGDKAKFEIGFSKICASIAVHSESALAGDMSKLPSLLDILK